MNICCRAKSRRFLKMGLNVLLSAGLLLAVLLLPQVGMAQDAGTFEKSMTLTKANTTDLMSKSQECVKHNWSPQGVVCCLPCDSCPDKCAPKMKALKVKIDYWEPSEVIEVSCRTGYSMLSPGNVPTRGGSEGGKMAQSCVGFNRPGNSRWFFEARVWAINGYDGGLRHQAMGGTKGEQVRQCTLENTSDLPWGNLPNDKHWGYGVKILDFQRGAANGPAGSWRAYISDSDPAWAEPTGGKQTEEQACKIGSADLPNCWGPMTRTGWVSHPNPKVAAALVAWRAHEKARSAGKTSPPGKGGYQMALEYPYNNYSGAYGASMGAPSGGKTGSGCFKPGDSGPEWFGGMQPQSIPDFVKGLKPGDVTQVAEANPGVYIFTVWVHTGCTRYTGNLKPTPLCHYEGGS